MNSYLKDIINYDNAYQGVITHESEDTVNFYSLCKKVFEQVEANPDGGLHIERYKMDNFSIDQFQYFFQVGNNANEAEAIYDMLTNDNANHRGLEVRFFGTAYKNQRVTESNTVSFTTVQVPVTFTMTFQTSPSYSISVTLEPLIDGQTIPQNALITGDLFIKAYGYGEW